MTLDDLREALEACDRKLAEQESEIGELESKLVELVEENESL